MTEQANQESLDEIILRLVRQRGVGKSICPSEAARVWAPHNWRAAMPAVRAAACALADAGLIVITQKGRIVDGRTARGPIRLALPGDVLPSPSQEEGSSDARDVCASER
ncbi:MAG: DUF3253 domain-containing protein [Roseiflexus sp.]|nr:DUF3253 domain-containing protein [Roseiflexus sp.]